MNNRKLDLLGLVELKVRENNHTPIVNNMFRTWEVYNCLPNSVSRIWVAWNPNIFEGHVLSSLDQSINCKMKLYPHHTEEFILTVVYGYNEISNKRELWQDLRYQSQLYEPGL